MRKVAHIKLSNAEAEAMMKYADSDGDGLISFMDFRKVASDLGNYQFCPPEKK